MRKIKEILSNKWVSWAITILVTGLILYGLGRVIARDWEQIRAYPWRINGWWLAGSIVLGTVSIALSSKVMHRLIKAFGARIGFWKFAYIFWIANMGRYAPGKVLQVVGMLVMLKQQGISRRVTISAMALFQGMFILISGIVAVISMGPTFLKEVLPSVPGWIIIPIAVLGLTLSFPKIFERIINWLLKLTGREQIEYELSVRDWLVVLIALGAMWAAYAASFASLIRAVTPLPLSDFPYAGGTFLAAYIVGWIVLISPGGLGVREGIITLLLSALLPRGVAGIVSIISRPWTLIIELLLLAVVSLIYRIVMHGEAVIIRKNNEKTITRQDYVEKEA